MQQPSLFVKQAKATRHSAERVVLHALGEFQSRGKLLAGRELPLDRLRGALRRAAEAFDIDELTDDQAASTLMALGAAVRRIPSFAAKHPYRVNVHAELAARAVEDYRNAIGLVPK